MIWSPDYLGYTWAPGHPMNPVRLDLTMRLARALGLFDRADVVAPVAATDAELARIHTIDYIAAVKAAGAQPAPPVGLGPSAPFGLGTDDNPIFARMHEAAAVITGGTLEAARELADGRALRAVSIGGGMHHAMPSAASGFCVYNDVAVAISWLLDHGFERIAYLDVDVHHGDGVQHAFYDDPRVLTVSLHQHPRTLWPGTGWPGERGTGAGEGYAINVPLPPGTPDALWLRAFHAVVPGAVAAFEPQLVVSQCGVDTHADDPLADLALHVDGHRAAFLAMRELADRHCGGRWLAVGGGGYGLVRVVPRSWTHLVAAVLDLDLEPSTAVPSDWIAHVRAIAPRADPPTTMGEGIDVTVQRWDGSGPADDAPLAAYVDEMIEATRRSAFPLLGLDPEDPRD